MHGIKVVSYGNSIHKTKKMRWNVVLFALPNEKYHWKVREIHSSNSLKLFNNNAEMSKFDTLLIEKEKKSEQCEYVKCLNPKPISKTCVCLYLCVNIQVNIFDESRIERKRLYFLLCVHVHNIQLKSQPSLSLYLSISLGLEADIDFCLWYALITSNKSTFRARASSITYILYNVLCMLCVSSYVWVCAFKSKSVQSVSHWQA